MSLESQFSIWCFLRRPGME